MENLEKLRDFLGITQAEIAEMLGIKQSSYAHIKRGKSSLTLAQLEILMDKLKINPYWLLRNEGEMFYSHENMKNSHKEDSIDDSLVEILMNIRDDMKNLTNRVEFLEKKESHQNLGKN